MTPQEQSAIERDQKFFVELEEVLDEYFPKVEEEGEEKIRTKRSEALVLFAQANIIHSQRLAEELRTAREEGKQEGRDGLLKELGLTNTNMRIKIQITKKGKTKILRQGRDYLVKGNKVIFTKRSKGHYRVYYIPYAPV